MPIYEYRCQACGQTEEHVQRFSDPPMTECEACGGELKKQLTGAAFHLKGGGWYKDGYASTKPSSDGGSDSGGSKDSGSGDSSGSSGSSGGSDSGKKSASGGASGGGTSSAGSSD